MPGGELILLVLGTLAGLFLLRQSILWFVRASDKRLRPDAMQRVQQDFTDRDSVSFHDRSNAQ